VDRDSPVAFGYGAGVPVISATAVFQRQQYAGQPRRPRPDGSLLRAPHRSRQRGRQRLAHRPQNHEAETLVKQQPWEAKKLNEEEMRNNLSLIPAELRPSVILRFSDGKSLLLDGLLDKGGTIAEHAVVVDAHLGQGTCCCSATTPCIAVRRRQLCHGLQRHPQLPALAHTVAPAPSEKK